MRIRTSLGRRGFAIFISLAVLALLSVLASSFAIMSQMERSIAGSYVDKVRAKLVAESGIEKAVRYLSNRARSQAWEGLNMPNPNPGPPFYVPDTVAYGDAYGTPLENCSSPSLRESFANLQATPNNPARSGSLAATYQGGWDLFIDKILDAQGQVDLNATNPNLPTILENLGNAISQVPAGFGVNTGLNPIPVGRGTDIVNLRTTLGGRFASKDELLLRDASGNFRLPWMTPALFDALKDYVCVQCYRDTQVGLPNPSASFPAASYAPSAPSGGWIGRAPMNINTAPWAVLVAWAEGVRGYQMKAVTNPNGNTLLDQYAVYQKVLTTAITRAQAYAIASSVIQHRQTRPFRTPDDVASFAINPYFGQAQAGNRDPWQGYDLVHDPSVGVTEDQAAALVADAVPSLTTNKFFQMGSTWSAVDKTDLSYYTTETCFSSMGYFEIEALGRVMLPGSVVRAEARVRTVARVYRVLRQGSQQDFYTGGTPTPAGWTQVQTLPQNLDLFGTPSAWEGGIALSSKWLETVVGAPMSPWAGTAPVAGTWTRTNYNPYGNMTLLASTRTPGDMYTGGDLTTDGGVYLGNSSKTVSYHLSNYDKVIPGVSEEGALEFWVKLGTKTSVGTGETLLYMTTTLGLDPNNASNYIGETVKVERFGTQIRCSRLFWGYPTAAASPYYTLLCDYEVYGASDNARQWRPNTWHHIALAWKEYNAPPLNAITFNNDDGTLNGNQGYGQWLAGAPEPTDLWFWIDGVHQTPYLQRTAESRTYYWAGASSTTIARRVLLKSKTPPPGYGSLGPFPSTELSVGGYTTNSDGGHITYETLIGDNRRERTDMVRGSMTRLSNCTMDDLKLYDSGAVWTHNQDFTPPDRYRTTGGAQFQQSFDLTSLRAQGILPPNAVLGTISWPTFRPSSSALASPNPGEGPLWPSSGSNEAPYVSCWWRMDCSPAAVASSSTNATSNDNPSERLSSLAFSAPPNPPLQVGATATALTYRLDFQGAGQLPFTSTPVVQQVILTIVTSPQFVLWEVR